MSNLGDEVTKIYQERNKRLAALRSANGAPIYTPAEEARRREKLEADTAAKVRDLAEGRRKSAKWSIGHLSPRLDELSRDPFARLSTSELERAAALRPFVLEDVERLGYDQLAERLQQAADKVEAALLARYMRQRVESDAQAAYSNGKAPDRALRELSDQLTAFEDELIPAAERDERDRLAARVAEYQEIVREADDVEQWTDPDYKRQFAAKFGLPLEHTMGPYERDA